MLNGAAALALTDVPVAVEPEACEETLLGGAVADAVAVMGAGVLDYEKIGRMSPAIRTLAGETIGRVAMLALDRGDDFKFAVQARDEGRSALLSRHRALPPQHSDKPPEATIVVLVDEVLSIVAKVVAFERAWTN